VSIGSNAFQKCNNLTLANFPNCASIGAQAFSSCTKLTTAILPTCTFINDSVFYSCANLTALYLTGSSLCKLYRSGAFNGTPIGGYSTVAGTYGSIYVPASLVASYRAATNWAYYSSRFVAYDSTDIGGSVDLPSTIKFTLELAANQFTLCRADRGMTWSEWCNSEYNTFDFYIDNQGYVYNGNQWLWNNDASNTCAECSNWTIKPGDNYGLFDIAEEDFGWD
jgi:hypothetical protein